MIEVDENIVNNIIEKSKEEGKHVYTLKVLKIGNPEQLGYSCNEKEDENDWYFFIRYLQVIISNEIVKKIPEGWVIDTYLKTVGKVFYFIIEMHKGGFGGLLSNENSNILKAFRNNKEPDIVDISEEFQLPEFNSKKHQMMMAYTKYIRKVIGKHDKIIEKISNIIKKGDLNIKAELLEGDE